MKTKMKKTRKPIAILTMLAMVLSLDTGIVFNKEVKALEYDLENPSTDSDGITTWDCIYFGNYLQNDTNGDGVVNENDEKQPIKWRVLSVDGDDAFLLADQTLDVKPYNTAFASVQWDNCTLRSWLNGYNGSSNIENISYQSSNFLNTAFDTEEQKGIMQTNVINEDNPYYGTSGCGDTKDKVYILSIAEACNPKYGFYSEFEEKNPTRISRKTSYVTGKIKKLEDDPDVRKRSDWWLRSPGVGGLEETEVFSEGYGFMESRYPNNDIVGVRPVVHLDLSYSDLWSYAGKVSVNSGVLEWDNMSESSQMPAGSTENHGLRNPITDSKGVVTWDCIQFGNYWQEDTNGDGVADKNDEKQPVKWRVLSVNGDDAFLIADQNLDARPYTTASSDDEGIWETWGKCIMRSWLNGYGASENDEAMDYGDDNFIDAAFTMSEQEAILQTNIIDDIEDDEDGENDEDETQDEVTEVKSNIWDKIYLLSVKESSNALYGFNSAFYATSQTREAGNTSYTQTRGAWTSPSTRCAGNGIWWLRVRALRESNLDHSPEIFGNGSGYDAYHGIKIAAVRPVLHLNLSYEECWSYAGTVSSRGGSKTENVSSDQTPSPSVQPTVSPVDTPAVIPTIKPTSKPTAVPTLKPTKKPVAAPTENPSPDVSVVPDLPNPSDTPQPPHSTKPVSTLRPGSTGSPTPSATARPFVTVLPSPKTTISPSATPVTTQTLRKGQVFKDVKTKAYYKILSVTASGGKAAYLRPVDKKVKKVTIRDTVTWKGKKFKVTQIGNKAFKDYKKLQKVTIGRNVSVIGKKTFANCKSLKVVILTEPKQKLPKNAFAGCPKKLKVRKTH